MAMFSRLFQSKHRNHRDSKCKWSKNTDDQTWSSPNAMFDKSQMRLVVFKDHDIKGRQLLFDSKGIQKLEEIKSKKAKCCRILSSETKNAGKEKETTSVPPVSKYKFVKTSDTKLLGEMMFGSVAMKFQGTTLKVHTTRTPPQLMVSKVFIPSRPNRESGDENYDTVSIQSYNAEYSKDEYYVAKSVPMDVPSPIISQSSRDEDSGFVASLASSGSLTPFQSPCGTPTSSNCSINSLQNRREYRRWMRNQTTSLEFGPRKQRFPEEFSTESTSTNSSSGNGSVRRRCKLGIAVIFNLFEGEDEANKLFQNFFFSHITLIESHVNKLKMGMEEACLSKNKFLDQVFETFDKFRTGIVDLYTAPRLSEPVWLNMMAYSTNKYGLCHKFMKEFMTLSDKFDIKTTNFFVSTLVTAVLSHHLAWVPTVTPTGTALSRTYLDKHSAKWLDTLAKSHPYNPLWAQLGDLYGALGVPVRIARTIIAGKNADIVNKFLYVLSYFIRCSEVQEHIEVRLTEDEEDHPWQQVSDDSPRILSGDMSPIWENPRSYCNSPKSPLTPTNKSESWQAASAKPDNFQVLPNKFKLAIPGTRLLGASTNNEDVAQVERKISKSTFFDEIENSDSMRDGYNDVEVLFERKNSNSTFYVPLPSPEELNGTEHVFKTEPLRQKLQPEHLLDNVNTKVLKMIRCPSNNKENISPVLSPSSKITNFQHISPKETQFHHNTGNIPEGDSSKMNDLICRLSPTDANSRLQKVENVCHVGRVAVEPQVRHQDVLTNTNQSNIHTKDAGRQPDVYSKSDFPSQNVPIPRIQFSRMVSVQSTSSDFDEYFDSMEPHIPNHATVPESHSEFDEYFDSDGITVKTIDDTRIEGRETVLPSSGRCAKNEISKGDYEETEYRSRSEVLSQASLDSAFVDSMGSYLSMEYENPTHNTSCDTLSEMSKPIDNVENVYHRKLDKTFSDPSIEVQGILRPSVSRQDSAATERTLTPTDEFRVRISSFGRTNAPGRCRSVTPTELGRRRHQSSGSCDFDAFDPYRDMQEISLPKSEVTLEDTLTTYERNFGRSLLAGCSDHYMSDFVLHGTSDDTDLTGKVSSDLDMALQDSILDESVGEAVCIVANTDNWKVELASSLLLQSEKGPSVVLTASHLVVNMIESVQELWKLKMSPEFCLMHLEDRLQEVFFKSNMLAEYLHCEKKVTKRELENTLCLDPSDLPLLLAVAGTHSSLGFGLL